MSGSTSDQRGQAVKPGTLSAPGALDDAPVAGPKFADDGVETDGPGATLNGEPLAAVAKRYGLKPSAARPPIIEYIKSVWGRRYFVTGFATAQNVAMYTEARLGQVWQILTPLLNVAVYYLIFGLILNTKRGVPDFIAFLVIGVFVFNFTQRSFIISSRVMFDSLPLIRALYFPRACLPLGYVLIELQQLAISLVVIFATVLAVGQPITWYWLLIIPALILQTLFNVGAAFILARFGAGFDDVSQLLPFVVRTWFYASGVMFSIQTYSNLALHPTIAKVLQYNPAAIYITLVRDALLSSQRQSMPGAAPYSHALCTQYYHPPAYSAQRFHSTAIYDKFLNSNLLNSAHCQAVVSQSNLWLFAAAWAVVILFVGFIFFWRAEVRYGRG
ncbi:MAG TPA: ABC transporter permease [Streptosporangiaceae bacterium]|jgi:teichoic acid transport system permease protein